MTLRSALLASRHCGWTPVRLPARNPCVKFDDTFQSQSRSATMPENPGDAARTTILVVEPDILVRTTIAEYLRDCGYTVLEGGTCRRCNQDT